MKKAYQYFDQYRENEKNGGYEIASMQLFYGLREETARLIRSQGSLRRITTQGDINKIVKDVFIKQNNKWIKICDMAEKQNGSPVFSKDGFLLLCKKSFTEINFDDLNITEG